MVPPRWFTIAVSPRSVFYQSPMKIVEYMAMTKPVVAPAKGNIRDLVGQESEGLLFEEDDVDSLRGALDRLIRDPELRRKLGSQARQRVEQRHTWIHNARRVLELHERHARTAVGE